MNGEPRLALADMIEKLEATSSRAEAAAAAAQAATDKAVAVLSRLQSFSTTDGTVEQWRDKVEAVLRNFDQRLKALGG